MAFTAKDVAALREKTGCGMMDCKKALTASNGDMDAAVDYLREKGLAAATKKAGRIAAEGMAYAYVDGNVGVAVEVNAETDFVAKNADFQAFVKTVAETVASVNPADMDALLAAQAAGQSVSVEDLRKEKVLTIGENIKIRRFQRYEGAVTAYIHMGARLPFWCASTPPRRLPRRLNSRSMRRTSRCRSPLSTRSTSTAAWFRPT